MFKKVESDYKVKYEIFCSNSKAKIMVNESDINNIFESIYTAIISNIQKSLLKGSGWIIDSVIDHSMGISKYNPLARSSYIRLPKELDHPKKNLINIQNSDDNEFFKSSLVRYLKPVDDDPARITKADKDFAKKPDFKGIKFPLANPIFHFRFQIACSYGYKLVRFDDKFSKLFKKAQAKMQFTVILTVWSKKVNIGLKWWKNILKKNMWWLKNTIKILRTLLNVKSITMIMFIMLK